ncbi:sugar transferase [Pseudovibrio brasiliensis]|uniref:Sugar transferase n=1 Tax=Pseudovibrio brasiliensis TaxID=1898042 RepID=A0ABX8B0B1_9HYPH|nr:sugar transferase [Pseudovibrio brasiliensis]QUS58931.1 sugar transferase [Pseudovibrio brasiliensis]
MLRIFDIIFSFTVIMLTSPLMLLAAILVRTKFGSPIIFKQDRAGLNGEVFQIYKFRSMTDERDAAGNLLPDEKRLTKFGRFLRATSIDELPGFLNVLWGDMSVVGPRPQHASFLEFYSKRQMMRHYVKPGITGWAQVNGRNSIGWDDRFELDVWYVENKSFWLDMKIIFLTMVIVLRREGISAAGHATMPEFRGSQLTVPQND